MLYSIITSQLVYVRDKTDNFQRRFELKMYSVARETYLFLNGKLGRIFCAFVLI